MYILGISCYYHDSSACILRDGEIIAAADEERFSRKKHDNSFPNDAINFCLDYAGIGIEEVEYIAFYEKPLLKFDRLLEQHIANYPRSLKLFLKTTPSWLKDKLRIISKVKKLGYKGSIHFVPHHHAHAASAFYTSDFDESAIYTVDGVGEWATTTFGFGKDNKLSIDKQISFPHSIGLFYSTITAFLGFSVNNSEYKVMGLSAYGEMNRDKNKYYKIFKDIVDVKDDGSFRLDMQYFKYDWSDRMPSRKMEEALGLKIRKESEEINQAHKDIAAGMQLITEDVVIKSINHIRDIYDTDNLVIAGGVGLNSVINGKILSQSKFKNIWIQPHSGDGGTSMGAALYSYYSILENKRIPKRMNDAYLGPEESSDNIKQFIKERDIKYTEFKSREELISTVTDMLVDNKVIGWFQGRMEWGPRALGNRSILANPMNPDAQELLNTKVKHRETFRPFAPVVLADRAQEFFECDIPVPHPTDYMLMVYPIKKKWHKEIPSVTHVDGSGRLQTIRRSQNSLYYDLIKSFGDRTGIPILINTSFNIRGEPIVCTFDDAYRCMMGTEIDALIAGNFLILREENLNNTPETTSINNNSTYSLLDKVKIPIINIIVLITLISLLEIASRIYINDTYINWNRAEGHSEAREELFVRSDDSTLIYENNTNHEWINNWGARDIRDYQINKKEDVNRVVIIGDSVTYGSGVSIFSNFPGLLNKRIQNSQLDNNYELLSFGVPGYGTEQQLRLLESKIMQFDPDIILWGYTLNDPASLRYHDVIFLGSSFNNYRSGIVELLNRRAFEFREVYLTSRNNCPTTEFHSFLHCVYFDYQKENFRVVREIAEANNIDLHFIVFPEFPLDDRDKAMEDVYYNLKIHNELTELFGSDQVLDLYYTFSNRSVRSISFEGDIYHPNELGHYLASKAIYNYLLENEVIR